MEEAWTKTPEEVAEYFKLDIKNGLTEEQVNTQREKFGENALPAEEKTPFWKLVLSQFDDQLVKILLFAAIVSFILALVEEGEERTAAFVEPIVIMLILIANATVGVIQETNAEKAIEALKAYESPHAVVIRDGKKKTIPAIQVVPGDVVEVAVGDRAPADFRVIKFLSTAFSIDQSILTGESVSVSKKLGAINDAKLVAQDKRNIIFSGTNVTVGKARGIVIGTGSNTAIGAINQQMMSIEAVESPLQKKLDQFGDFLSKIITVICIVVWIINFGKFSEHGSFIKGAVYYFKIAVALAVAAIPEGLPAVVTTCLALGTRKMAKKNAIVRSLPSVETLGCTTVICSDKTGTLTTNEMSCVKAVIVNKAEGEKLKLKTYNIEGASYAPFGKITDDKKKEIDGTQVESLLTTSKICALCSESSVEYNQDTRKYVGIGEPTEIALKVLVEKIGAPSVNQSNKTNKHEFEVNAYWEQKYPKLNTLEFARDRKSMSVICRDGDRKDDDATILLCKGAPESIIERCDYVQLSSKDTIKFTPTMKAQILELLTDLGGKQALRCLGVALKRDIALDKYDLSDTSKFVEVEKNMTFVGITCMRDPPRPEVPQAISKCRTAGIRVIVITGDNKSTAEAICRGIGLFSDSEEVSDRSFTGREFESMSAEQKADAAKRIVLLSRVEPAHKSEMVALLRKDGHVVAMTGDGVNDAPALKQADIGVAMGSGTAVAKSASEMILADDNFATIIVAVEEGRAIYNNTKQFIRYLISSNIGEVACIFLTAALGLPEALIPVQLLWVNLVTDGLPATALGFNKPDKDIMEQAPRGTQDPIIDAWLFFRYLVIGVYVGAATVGGQVFWFTMYEGGPQLSFKTLSNWTTCSGLDIDPKWKGCDVFENPIPSSVALSVLVTIEMFNAMNSLSENQSLLQMPVWSNLWLVLAIALSFSLHFLILYVPFFANLFAVAPLGFGEWKVVLMLSAPIIVIDEILKLVSRLTKKNQHVKPKRD